MLFNQLGLTAELLRAVDEQGYKKQPRSSSKLFPLYSKAAMFLPAPKPAPARRQASHYPCCSDCSNGTENRRSIRALVLTPTRELAAQVAESVRDYGSHLPFRTAVIFGGVNINTQIAKLRKGVDIVVATPGRFAGSHAAKNHRPVQSGDTGP